jgi:hypothetical protein
LVVIIQHPAAAHDEGTILHVSKLSLSPPSLLSTPSTPSPPSPTHSQLNMQQPSSRDTTSVDGDLRTRMDSGSLLSSHQHCKLLAARVSNKSHNHTTVFAAGTTLRDPVVYSLFVCV